MKNGVWRITINNELVLGEHEISGEARKRWAAHLERMAERVFQGRPGRRRSKEKPQER